MMLTGTHVNIVRMPVFAFLLTLSCTVRMLGDDMPRNYQINGSFEYATNPDIPDCWAGTGRFYRSNGLPWGMCDEDGIREFREKFRLDHAAARHGQQSLCLQRPFHLLGMQMDVPADRDYTVSLYMKGEFRNRRVKIAVAERDTQALSSETVVLVAREWSRYQLHLDRYPHGRLSVFVVPLDTGKLWVDAVQIESGTEATPFKPCWYDKGFTLPQPVVHPGPGAGGIPQLVLGQPTTKPPVIDGVPDEPVWENSPGVSMHDYMGAPASVETRVKAAYDDKTLYLAFTCADPGNARGMGDSIEIFFDVLGIGDPYYQFIFDAKGAKHNYRSLRGIHEWAWEADWHVAVQTADAEWTAEVGIPFAVFPDTAEMAQLQELRMNVCRNYAPGPEKYLSWAPVTVGFLEPEHFGRVTLGDDANALAVPDIALDVSNAADSLFNLNFTVQSGRQASQQINAAVCLEEQGQAVQCKAVQFGLRPGEPQTVSLAGFKIKSARCRATVICTNTKGEKLKHLRAFLDVPHPMRLYPEYSYYTTEKDARIVVEFNTQPLPEGGRLVLTLRLAGYPTKLAEEQFSPDRAGGRQIFSVPVGGRGPGHVFALEGRLLDEAGHTLMRAGATLLKHKPNDPEVKINRINRGIYLNGEPYIPYGILTPYYDMKQLRFYRKSGFDFISFVSHWHSPEKGLEFLTNCEHAGINAVAFHVARPGRVPPPEAAALYRHSRSLIGFIPNDEESDRQVYGIAVRNNVTYPHILSCINHNFTSYRAFANRLDGFPGDVLSIDRYPLCMLPKGRPHTTSEIYSVERCIEMMDRDGKRERMPLFFWLQAGERFSKEPTPEELTWIHYILLANHCVGFTYFAGMPASSCAWDRMVSLNREIQSLKPYLFTLEPEPEIGFANEESLSYIRVLPKTLEDELLLICVNRAMKPIGAAIDLSDIAHVTPGTAAVLFEGRSVPVDAGNVLRDRFGPLHRHVYKLSLR